MARLLWKTWVVVWGVTAAISLAVAQVPDSTESPDRTQTEEPLDIGLAEEVAVRLVLVDFLVLDRAGRTVPGLAVDDFKLLIGGRRTPIETLDVACPAGGVDDPVSGGEPTPPPARADGEAHKIVLVFDYDHMNELAATYENALRMIERYATREEEHMLVSLSEVVRIEVPFTQDLDEIRWALQRMRNDRELFAGNHERGTERRFFYRIKALFDILAGYPGRKTVVLFSGPFGPDEFVHDAELRELSALSGISRTAVYPVDTSGLQAFQQFGGPEELRRLANETGGRITAQTNDIGLAYAKAQRDLGCTYTLSFRDEKERLGDKKRIQIKLPKKRGHRIVQPEYYVIRSPKQESQSLRETAGMAPHLFEDDSVHARFDVMGTKATDRWQARISIGFDPPAAERVAGARWRVEGHLRKPRGTVIRSFVRELVLAADEVGAGGVLTVFEDIGAPPGEFTVSVIVADPTGGKPLTKVWSVDLAPLPLHGAFLIGQVLGSSGPDGFEPSLDPHPNANNVLESLTTLCLAGSVEAAEVSLEWAVEGEGGRSLIVSPPIKLVPNERGAMRCTEIIEPLDVSELEPGAYALRVRAMSESYLAESDATPFTAAPNVDGATP